MAKQGFDVNGIVGAYRDPKQAKQIAIKSLKERCNAMKLDKENGITAKLTEKNKLIKLIKASKDYMKGSTNQVMIEEDKVKGFEADLTRLDLEINEMAQQLAVLKQHKFDFKGK